MMRFSIADFQSPIFHSAASRVTCPVIRQSAIGNRKSAGFTFVEVLFAIIILGIGMIMIAGILPVAIKQQADTRDEITAKAVCEAGFAYLSTIVQSNPDAFVPTNFSDTDDLATNPTPQGNFAAIRPLRTLLNTGISGAIGVDEELAGKVVPLSFDVTSEPDLARYYSAFDAIANSRVSSIDPRYQYLAFYRRDQGAPTLKLIIVALKLQNTEAIKGYGFDLSAPPPPPARENTLHHETINDNNGPFLCEVEIRNQALEADRIVFTTPPSAPVLGEGAFVIIADSRAQSNNTDRGRPFRNNGRVFQLGQQRTDLDSTGKTWDLASGYDLDVASVGPDGLQNTSDDLIDGSMDTGGTYTVNGANVTGTSAQAWVIGKGLFNPTVDASNNNKYIGRVQDAGVLIADVPIR